MIKQALFAAMVALWASPSRADEISLLFATTNPPEASSNVGVMHPWAEHLNAQGKGVVQLVVRDGPTVANQSNFYSRALDDVVQVTWGLTSQVAGKFPRSLVTALPYVATTSVDASVAFWRLYKTGLLDREYDEIEPLFFCAYTQFLIHTVKPLPSLDNLKGGKFGVNTEIGGEIIARLGGAPSFLVVPDYYVSLTRGLVGGILASQATLDAFKLDSVTPYHTGGELGSALSVVFMTKKRWLALPANAQKIIAENSGEKESRACGTYVDADEAADRERAAKDPHQVTVKLTPAQESHWRQLVAPVVADWAGKTPDGPAVLAKYRQLTKDVAAGR